MGVTIITKYILDIFESLTDKEKEFISYLENKDNISFNELPEKIQNSFSKIPKINKIYKCKKCGKIANFYRTEKQYTGDLFIRVKCEENHTFEFDYWDFPIQINSYLNLTEIKEEISKKNNTDLLNKLRKESLFFIIKLIQLYNNVKDKIKAKNYGDEKNNLGFALFENLLSNFIYYNDDENKAFNNLKIYDFSKYNYDSFINSKYFELYDKIQELPNGKKFNLKKSIQIPLDRNFNIRDEENYLNFYQLCENFYCFKYTRDHTMVIKGYLGNLQFNNNNENETKVYNLYDDKIIFNGKKIINSYVEKLKNMIDKKNIIYIDNDLIMGYKDEYYSNSLFLINSNLHLLSYETFSFKLNDYIYKIISLKNNPIKTILKNEEDVQFLLISNKNIYLFEYIKCKKSIELIKNYNYSNKDLYMPSINYSFYKNILVFYEEEKPYIFFFNLNSFQLESIIDINKIEGFRRIISLDKKNKYEIDCFIRTKNETDFFSFNMKNKKIKRDAPTITKIIFMEDYYPDNYFICLSNNHYFLSKDNDVKYFTIFDQGSYDVVGTRKSCIININEKEFAVFAFNYYKGENETFRAYVDIYQFI